MKVVTQADESAEFSGSVNQTVTQNFWSAIEARNPIGHPFA
jgi:hypothetical protein